MAEIVLSNVAKTFAGGVRAVDHVTLTVGDGEFLVLVGPSGCGKTTLLRLVAGLEPLSSGSISIGGRDVTDAAPRRRDVAMVFQNYALYPHMNVRENLAYGLKVRGTPRRQIKQRVNEVAQLLGLEDYLKRRPSALSGGQRQRVAMGRAIVREPAAFLMDEPLSNLDAKLRVTMRGELARLHERLRTTTVFVTHDQVEAMTLGQRVAVMREGRIQQLATPQELYESPINLYVAAFIGSPAMNLAHATVVDGALEFADLRIPLPVHVRPVATDVIVGLRPEVLQDAAFANSDLPTIEVEVGVVEELGPDAHIIFPVDTSRVDLGEIREAREGEDDILLADDKRALFTARVDPRTAAKPGRKLVLAIDSSRLHFFDPTNGTRIAKHDGDRAGATA